MAVCGSSTPSAVWCSESATNVTTSWAWLAFDSCSRFEASQDEFPWWGRVGTKPPFKPEHSGKARFDGLRVQGREGTPATLPPSSRFFQYTAAIIEISRVAAPFPPKLLRAGRHLPDLQVQQPAGAFPPGGPKTSWIQTPGTIATEESTASAAPKD